MTADGCPFCTRIAAGDYDTEDAYAVMFEPLNPVTRGHRLIVPKLHVCHAAEDPLVTAMTMRLAADLAARERLVPCNLITSVGRAATQTIPHLHIHIVPRRSGDGLHLPWTGQMREGTQ